MSPLYRWAVAAWSCALVLGTTTVARASTESLSLSSAPEPTTAESVPTNPDTTIPRQQKDSKRFVVARDFGLAIPFAHFANEAAPMYGPLVRLGFHPNDRIELGVRFGYQRGLDKEIAGVTGSLSAVPVYASARWFALGDRSGPYAGLELGVNIFRQKSTARTSFWDVDADETWVRPSANIGVGYVWSRSLPIDVRAQVASLDLVRGNGPIDALTFGVTAGYSIFF